MAYKPAMTGEVRGPWDSSTGSPYPYQDAYYSGNGWVYYHSKISLKDARTQAEKAAAEHMASIASNESE